MDQLVGPSAAGLAFDIGHSYTLSILVSICGNMVAAALMTLISSESARTIDQSNRN
jgi:OFA family oxalate/formate antiporter-like MFS transporter